MARALERWFGAAARSLPWRVTGPDGRRDPYAVLVSELMLQQTQVSRVVERFEAFMRRFPTVAALARADEADVLALWAGLGYYRRARHLHAAAKRIVSEHGGEMPGTAEALRELPGVGRYTAGAIASMALGQRVPLVDGNVARVLMRLDAKPGDVAQGQAWAWERAGELVERSSAAGVFNEGLMELGATVCVPGRPRCEACPLAAWCVARAEGRQTEIPAPKPAATRRGLTLDAAVVVDETGRVLVERRGAEGLWAGLWQPPTCEAARGGPVGVAKALRVDATLMRAGSVSRTLTHRNLSVRVWVGRVAHAAATDGRRWVMPADAERLGMSSAHAAVLAAGLAALEPKKRAPRGQARGASKRT